MSDPNINFNSAKSKFERLLRSSKLDSVSREVSDVSASVDKLPAEISEVRGRGYAFRSYLEKKSEVLQEHWDDIKRRVHHAIDDEVDALRDDVDQAERVVSHAERNADEPDRLEKLIERVDETLDRLEEKAEAAAERVRTMYQTLKSDLDSTYYQLREIKWVCDMKDEASFEFLAGESVFLAAEAEWVATGKGKEDPDGILFLTDQRLIFEQKEKVGKRLGIFGGKKVQEVELDIPLHHIEQVEAENKGMFGGKDMLHFTLSDGPHSKVTIEVKGSADNKFWVKQLNRMAAGELDDERAIEPDAEMIEQLQNAPTNCHVCSATLPMVTAGQRQIECEYCGTVIRL